MLKEISGSFWKLIASAAVLLLLYACAPGPTAIHGESPIKATGQPTASDPEPTATNSPVPNATASPEGCVESKGEIIEDSYTQPDGQEEAVTVVYLPPCYRESGEPYPVALFLHGFPQDEQHWIDLGAVGTYEALLASNEIGPIVLVFPYQPEPYFTQTDGGPDSLEELLLEDLLVEINQDYNISSTPSERAILGVSRGGVWALEVGMRHPETFDIVVAMSPALAYNHPRRAYDPFEIARSAEQVPEHILISAGDREPQFADEIDRFVDTLERSEIDFEYLRHEGRHENEAWRSIMEQVFVFLGERMQD